MSGDADMWLAKEGLAALHVKDLIRTTEAVPNQMGVYMVFLPDVDKLLSRAGFDRTDVVAQWSVYGHQHAYTGEGIGIRSRALLHIFGTICDSTLRESLLSLQFTTGVLWDGEPHGHLLAMEQKLTRWMVDNAWLAFRSCSYCKDVEADLISRMPSPFNLTHNSKSPFRSSLKKHREKFRDHLRNTGQRYNKVPMPPLAWLKRADHLVSRWLRANHLAGLLPTQSTSPLS